MYEQVCCRDTNAYFFLLIVKVVLLLLYEQVSASLK